MMNGLFLWRDNFWRGARGILAAAVMIGTFGCGMAARADGLASSNNAFAFDLYAKLKTQPGNLFFSPYSVSTCLGMTYAGARGNTATEMAKTLHFGPDAAQVANDFGALAKALAFSPSNNGVELDIANGLWAEQTQPLQKDFLDVTTQHYLARIKQVDFKTKSGPVRGQINTWVSDRTKGKITDLLPPGSVSSATRLVLVNAIYFKGEWQSPFKTNATRTNVFYTNATQTVSVPFMRQEARFDYMETTNFQLLAMPYEGESNGAPTPLSMVLVLPRKKTGLGVVEKTLSPAMIESWLKEAHPIKVNVSLPKFKMTSGFNLADTMASLGMPTAFTPRADFSGMNGAHDLFISAIVHKAYIDVYERGTEAAAATGVMVATRAVMPQKIISFNADHPFFFLIRDNQSGSILFMGRVENPAK